MYMYIIHPHIYVQIIMLMYLDVTATLSLNAIVAQLKNCSFGVNITVELKKI